MADYRNAVLCTNGERLLKLAVSGEAKIKFTSIKTSSTRYEATQLKDLTDIGDVKQSSGISASTKDSPNTVSLYTSFSNAKLVEGYYVRNFGIYAADPDDETGETEILYAVVNADEGTNPATFIPAYSNKGTSGVDFTCEIVVANSEEVTIVLDENAGVPLSVFNTFAEQFTEGMQKVDKTLESVDTKLSEFNTTIEEVKTSFTQHTSEDALFSDDGIHILTNTDNFQDDGKGSGYVSTPSGISSDTGSYMKDVQGTNDTGFVFKTGSGSSSTYFCDYGGLYDACVANFGGNYSNGDLAGVCYLSVNHAASYSYAYIGGRVMFLAPNS